MAEEAPIARQWAQAAVDGDQAAFGKLVEHYQHAVYNLAYRLLGDPQEAEDATQEAFLRAYANLARYDPERSFKTWLLSIASNHCIDRLRKRRLTWLSIEDEQEAVPPIALASQEPGPEEVFDQGERSANIQALLAQIQPEYRTVLVLRYWYDMSYTEIAEALDTTESAVKSRLFRARQAVAQLLGPSTPPVSAQAMWPAMEGS